MGSHAQRLVAARAAALAVVVVATALAGCGGANDASARHAATQPTSSRPASSNAQAAAALRRTRIAEGERMKGLTGPARTCLRKLGYKVSGGAPRVGDDRAPDYQLVLNGSARGHGAIVAYYSELDRAAHYEAITARNARKLPDASVERRGAINIVWVRLHDEALRGRIRACVLRDS